VKRRLLRAGDGGFTARPPPRSTWSTGDHLHFVQTCLLACGLAGLRLSRARRPGPLGRSGLPQVLPGAVRV